MEDKRKIRRKKLKFFKKTVNPKKINLKTGKLFLPEITKGRLQEKKYENNGNLNKMDFDGYGLENENEENGGTIFEIGNGSIGVPSSNRIINYKNVEDEEEIEENPKTSKLKTVIKWGVGAAAVGAAAYLGYKYLYPHVNVTPNLRSVDKVTGAKKNGEMTPLGDYVRRTFNNFADKINNPVYGPVNASVRGLNKRGELTGLGKAVSSFYNYVTGNTPTQ